MTTSQLGQLFHFTHVRNLASIVSGGLLCDAAIRDEQTPFTEVAEPRIKARRRERQVPLWSGVTVADCVPFYFAARSPMLYSIYRGNVPTYTEGQDEVIYLLTSVDTLVQHKLPLVFTDRNASLELAQFSNDLNQLGTHVDWEVMKAQMWQNTPEEPDRMEKRMAELLVYSRVPWAALTRVVARSVQVAELAEQALATVGISAKVDIEPDWYF